VTAHHEGYLRSGLELVARTQLQGVSFGAKSGPHS